MPVAVTEKVAVCPAVMVTLEGCVVIEGATGGGIDRERRCAAGRAAYRVADHDRELRAAGRSRLRRRGVARSSRTADGSSVLAPLIAQRSGARGGHGERGGLPGGDRHAGGLRGDRRRHRGGVDCVLLIRYPDHADHFGAQLERHPEKGLDVRMPRGFTHTYRVILDIIRDVRAAFGDHDPEDILVLHWHALEALVEFGIGRSEPLYCDDMFMSTWPSLRRSMNPISDAVSAKQNVKARS